MSARELSQEAAGLVDDSGGLAPFIRDYGIGGVLYAIFLALISTIDAAGELVLAPFRALADGLANLVSGTIGQGVEVISAGGDTAIVSLTDGAAALLGPFAFPFSVAITMLAVFVFVNLIGRIEFSPLVFLRS